jgi:hypothetical protein
MPYAQHSPAATRWTIHSVVVRTRDGPERLEQVYRRLLLDNPPVSAAPEKEGMLCMSLSTSVSQPNARDAIKPSTAS